MLKPAAIQKHNEKGQSQRGQGTIEKGEVGLCDAGIEANDGANPEKGENPSGFTAQTCNGTAKDVGTGWNKVDDWKQEQVQPDATRPAGRSNRTGE